MRHAVSFASTCHRVHNVYKHICVEFTLVKNLENCGETCRYCPGSYLPACARQLIELSKPDGMGLAFQFRSTRLCRHLTWKVTSMALSAFPQMRSLLIAHIPPSWVDKMATLLSQLTKLRDLFLVAPHPKVVTAINGLTRLRKLQLWIYPIIGEESEALLRNAVKKVMSHQEFNLSCYQNQKYGCDDTDLYLKILVCVQKGNQSTVASLVHDVVNLIGVRHIIEVKKIHVGNIESGKT